VAGDLIKGEWGTITFELPDLLEDFREQINSVAELLVTFLDIALAALRLVEAFAFSYLDPMAALVQAIVVLVRQTLDDFRQVGLYMTGDYALLEWPFDDIRGGYSAYEARMIGRLTDRADPTRPDVSSVTEVFAFFSYLSLDVSDLERVNEEGLQPLISFVKQLLDLFGGKFFPTGSLPVPVITKVEYGASTTGVFQGLSNIIPVWGDPASKARVTWKVPQPSTRNPSNPLSSVMGPGGFLVTVSTLPEGIPLHLSRPQGDAGRKENKSGDQQQPREYLPCRDRNGKPIVLHGGYDMLAFDEGDVGWNQAIEGGKVKDGAYQVFGVESPAKNSVLPLEFLKDGNGDDATYYFQRTFQVSLASVVFQWATEEFGLVLDLDDMPHHAEVQRQSDGTMELQDLGRPSTYYVRVVSTSAKIASETGWFAYDFTSSAPLAGNVVGQPAKVMLANGESPQSISEFSQPAKVTFPRANTKEFLEAVQAALVVLALSRPDLPIVDELAETKGSALVELAQAHQLLLKDVALVRTGLEKHAGLLDRMYPEYRETIETKGWDPADFRRDLMDKIQTLAGEIRDQSGASPEFEDLVVAQSKGLRSVTWGDILNYGESVTPGAQLPVAKAGLGDQTLLQGLQQSLLGEKHGKVYLGDKSNMGLASNPYSIGLPPKDCDELFLHPGIVRKRKPHFIEAALDPGDFQPEVRGGEAVAALLDAAEGTRREIYLKYLSEDRETGELYIEVPTEVVALVRDLEGQKRTVGSADLSPCFFTEVDTLRDVLGTASADFDTNKNDGAGVLYCRSLFAAMDGEEGRADIYGEASLVLGMLSSVLRPPGDGEWIAVRLFDAIPALEDFFESIQDWLDSLAEAVKDVAAAILAYIDFIEARLVELQQLIRRINALVQTILGYIPMLPRFSGLMLIAPGTDGITSGLVTATNKPSDSPLAYGAGLAVLVPLIPGSVAIPFLLDLIVGEEGDPADTTPAASSSVPDAFGLEGIAAPPALPGPNDEPDVL